MTFIPPRPIERVTSRMHRLVYRRTGGRLGGSAGSDNRPVGLLATIGRKSGVEREWPVLALEDGGRYVVVASNGGRDDHPAWFFNLQATPEVTLQLGERLIHATARVAVPGERQTLWPRLTAMHKGFADFARKTERIIPVVILEPRGTV
jgi:deazaflavin-dependent oxidoreductase (nitroreductase family)